MPQLFLYVLLPFHLFTRFSIFEIIIKLHFSLPFSTFKPFNSLKFMALKKNPTNCYQIHVCIHIPKYNPFIQSTQCYCMCVFTAIWNWTANDVFSPGEGPSLVPAFLSCLKFMSFSPSSMGCSLVSAMFSSCSGRHHFSSIYFTNWVF